LQIRCCMWLRPYFVNSCMWLKQATKAGEICCQEGDACLIEKSHICTLAGWERANTSKTSAARWRIDNINIRLSSICLLPSSPLTPWLYILDLTYSLFWKFWLDSFTWMMFCNHDYLGLTCLCCTYLASGRRTLCLMLPNKCRLSYIGMPCPYHRQPLMFT